MGEVADTVSPNREIQLSHERAVRAGLHDDRLVDHGRSVHAIVGMTAEEDVNPRHDRRELAILREAQVREDHHEIDAVIASNKRNQRPQLGVAHRHLERRALVGWQQVLCHNGGQADDGHLEAATLDDGEWRQIERRAVIVRGEKRVGQALRDLAHAREAVGQIPVDGHPVQFEGAHRCDHGGPAGLHRRHRAMKRIAVIQREHRALAFASDRPKQRGDSLEPAAGAQAHRCRDRTSPDAARDSRAGR